MNARLVCMVAACTSFAASAQQPAAPQVTPAASQSAMQHASAPAPAPNPANAMGAAPIRPPMPMQMNPPPPPAVMRAPAPPAPPTPPVKGLPPDAPQIVINGGTYSPVPQHRIAIVNGNIVREGADLGSGVVLEKIEPNGVVLAVHGSHYHVMY